MSPARVQNRRVRPRDLLDAIGRTPLIEIHELNELPAGTRLFAKLESVNPGGSI